MLPTGSTTDSKPQTAVGDLTNVHQQLVQIDEK